MREIKFRAWDKESKEMFRVIMLAGDTNDRDNLLVSGRGGTIQGAILMQYTGLKDKNGKEIYEGDILKLEGGGEPCLGSVGFERGCFTFNALWLNKEKEYMPELYRYTFFAELDKGKLFKDCIVVEIIGNIHENPELIK